ncbi:MAG: hypothetical protein AAGH89_16220, partial [Verrucomicrobiota bacterium]
GNFMGYTVRTQHYRYVEWRENDSGKVLASELYDLTEESEEATNLAADPEKAVLLEKHQQILKDGWQAALPPSDRPSVQAPLPRLF